MAKMIYLRIQVPPIHHSVEYGAYRMSCLKIARIEEIGPSSIQAPVVELGACGPKVCSLLASHRFE
jgi:hypothetical protein